MYQQVKERGIYKQTKFFKSEKHFKTNSGEMRMTDSSTR